MRFTLACSSLTVTGSQETERHDVRVTCQGLPMVARTRRASEPACTENIQVPSEPLDGSAWSSPASSLASLVSLASSPDPRPGRAPAPSEGEVGSHSEGSLVNAAVSAPAGPSRGWKVRSSRDTGLPPIADGSRAASRTYRPPPWKDGTPRGGDPGGSHRPRSLGPPALRPALRPAFRPALRPLRSTIVPC